MGKIEVIGQKFNRMTVIEDQPSKGGRRRVLCKCDCGNMKTVDLADLRRGHTTSCGCFNREKVSQSTLVDLTGKQFGYLKVLERDTNYRGKGVRAHWFCECTKCGTIKSMSSSGLLDNNVQSCGCQKSKGEIKIAQILTSWQINFITEYKFPDHKNRRYDFALINKNNEVVRLIEFDGIQHYTRPRANHWAATSSLEETRQRDAEKNQIAKEKGIELIRIPYWHLDKINIINLLDDTYLIKE